MHLADMLSSAYLPYNGKEVDDFESVNMVRYLPISDQRLDEIRAETRKDQSLKKLSEPILVGRSENKKDAPALTALLQHARQLTVQDGLFFKGSSVVIPKSLRADMKMKIHSSHLGIEACLRRARECIYWPGMSAEMKQHIYACETCRELESMTHAKETLMPHEDTYKGDTDAPRGPISSLGENCHGHLYSSWQGLPGHLDYYSNFWEVDRLPNTKASTTILKLKSHFAFYGIPDQVISDDGPQFIFDEFAVFSKTWDFELLTSSPGNSKANGKTESGVKIGKRILKKSIRAGTNLHLAVHDYRNMPTQGMTTSPAQRLMSRRTKTLLPTTQSLLLPRTIYLENEKKELRQRQQAQAK